MSVSNSRRIVVGVIAAALMAACKSYTGPSGGITVPHGDVLIVANASTMAANAFSPDTLTISLAASGKVIWSNGDVGDGVYVGGTTHSLVGDGGTFTLGDQAPGRTKQFTFTSTGTFGYHCSIHPTMIGAIIVTP